MLALSRLSIVQYTSVAYGFISVGTYLCNHKHILGRDGGIGRHARLKIWCPLGRAGSSPARGTTHRQFIYYVIL